MRNKMKGYVDWGAIGLLAIVAAIFVGIPALAMLGTRHSCVKQAEYMKLEAKWGPVVGCVVKVDDRYFPIESVRYINGTITAGGTDGE